MPHALVLSVGSDSNVLNTRELILRSAGYIVVSALSIREAIYLFQGGDFDVAVLCHTLPVKDCERLTSAVRASGSRIPIACVSGGVPVERNAFADVILDKEPAAFLRGIEELLSRFAQVTSIGAPDWGSDGDLASAGNSPKYRASRAISEAAGDDGQAPQGVRSFFERKKA